VAEEASSEPTIKKCSLQGDSSLILLSIRKIGYKDLCGMVESESVNPH
jgi:hypothetical protein